jgi:hypothetical protein
VPAHRAGQAPEGPPPPAAAELIETDLWQQYAELAQGNPGFQSALGAIDDDLTDYTVDVTEDELSHAQFLNAYLKSIGEEPVDLDPFRTVQPPHVKGLRQVGRLTNLTDLTVDTSYFTRYQSTKNPDFGATFPQIATVRDQPAIPTSDGLGAHALDGIARVAAFHFPSIEQGGTSLYDQFVPFVASREVRLSKDYERLCETTETWIYLAGGGAGRARSSRVSFAAPENRAEAREQLVLAERLGEVADDAGPQGALPRRLVRIGGDQDRGDGLAGRGQPTVELGPGHPRHLHVRDHAGQAAAAVERQEILGALERHRTVAERSDQARQGLAHRRVVVHDRDHDLLRQPMFPAVPMPARLAGKHRCP